jgi:hypothetical protein
MKNLLGIASLAMLLVSTSAPAGELPSLSLDRNKVHIGSGVICDTQDQVKRFVSLMTSKGAGGALQAVNRETDKPLGCGMATVAFRAGKDYGEMRNDKGSFKIVEIEVIAGTANGSWHMIVPRRTQFTAIPLPGVEI